MLIDKDDHLKSKHKTVFCTVFKKHTVLFKVELMGQSKGRKRPMFQFNQLGRRSFLLLSFMFYSSLLIIGRERKKEGREEGKMEGGKEERKERRK